MLEMMSNGLDDPLIVFLLKTLLLCWNPVGYAGRRVVSMKPLGKH
jgi:hypothetical protein